VTDPSTPEATEAVAENSETTESRRSKRAGGGEPGTRRSRRQLLLLGSVVAVLVVVALALLLTQRLGGQMEPLTIETTTVTVPPPTPAEPPIERDTSTALLAALPDAVIGWSVSEQVESAAMTEAGALEGWQLTYTGSETAVVLQVGQWPTPDEATAAAADLVGEATATDQGEVLVDGAAAGTFTTYEVDGGERSVWTNATVVLVAEGPVGTTSTFYDAFPF
jgi:hypothetical protein